MANKQARKDNKIEPAPDMDKPNSARSLSNWQGGKIIWGTVLVSLGVILLLANFGVLSIDWSAIWQLWPIAIIVAGLSVMALRGWIGVVVSIVAAVVIVGLMLLVLTGNANQQLTMQSRDFYVDQPAQDINKAEVSVDAGAGSLVIGSHSDKEIVKGNLKSNWQKLNIDTNDSNGMQRVNLSLDGDGSWWRGGVKNDLSLSLSRDLPIILNVDVGAADVRADLSLVNTELLTLESGASNIWLKLGDKQASSRVTIDTGVSSLRLQVPEQSGIKLVINDGLSNQDLPEGYEEVSESIYQSAMQL